MLCDALQCLAVRRFAILPLQCCTVRCRAVLCVAFLPFHRNRRGLRSAPKDFTYIFVLTSK